MTATDFAALAASAERVGRYAVNAVLTDGAVVPGMVVSAAELVAMGAGGYSQVWCLACGESVADCPRVRKHGLTVPGEWSTWAGEDV